MICHIHSIEPHFAESCHYQTTTVILLCFVELLVVLYTNQSIKIPNAIFTWLVYYRDYTFFSFLTLYTSDVDIQRLKLWCTLWMHVTGICLGLFMIAYMFFLLQSPYMMYILEVHGEFLHQCSAFVGYFLHSLHQPFIDCINPS